jgi:serine protease
MKKIVALVFYFLTIVIGICHAQETNVVPGNLILMLQSDAAAENLTNELQYINGIKTNLKEERLLSKSMHIYLFNFDETAINRTEMLSAARRNPLVKIVQFNHTFEERVTPNDSLFGLMWDMHNTGQSGGTAMADIQALQAWDITTGGVTAAGDSIVVAVIDNGFDITQEDISFWKNNQEIAGDSIDNDNNGYIDDVDGWNGSTANDFIPVASHGTHVSGIIGAKGNNQIGVTGVNWNVKIMAVSYGNSGSALEANAIASYAYVMEQRRLYNQTNGAKGAFVVSTNSSFGINNGQPTAYPLWCAMYDSLGSVGILSAAATANSTINVDTQGDIPTACASNWLITVTNTTNTDHKNSSCAYGLNTIDLGAPGTNILSTYPSNSYFAQSGTSMASPHVAGAIALMLSVACPDLINQYKTDPAGFALILKDSLLNTVDTISSLMGLTVSGGRLNLYKAVKAVASYCPGLSVNELASKKNAFEIMNAFPNPTDDLLNITYNNTFVDPSTTLVVSDILGNIIDNILLTSNTIGLQNVSIDVSTLQSGVYLFKIQNNHLKSNTLKVVIY